jgi:hypothetical protein
VVTEPTSVVKAGEAAVFQRIESGTQREKLAHYERTIGEAHSFVQAQLQAAHEHWVLAAGQSLQEIRDGQLYKSGYSSFEAYVQDRWKMQRAHAYRLISAVPVVRALVGVTRTELQERQMRALVPVAQQHGEHAVREVWEEAERRQRTSGAGLEEVRKFLGFDVDGAEEGGEPEQAPQRSVASVAILQRAWKQLDADTFRSAAQENPTEARRIVSELRELLDTVEKDMKG